MPRPNYPTIEPLPPQTPRPFWSVMIPTYNRATYLERTLRSVLEQAPGPDEMQIEVLDNASTQPAVAEVVHRVGGDRVSFVQHPSNIGVAGNWNSCAQRARGQWVHILHDDDMVRPGFYDAYRQFIEAHPNAGLVLSRPILIDEEDDWLHLTRPPGANRTEIWPDGLFRFIHDDTSAYLRCPTVVVARRAYEQVGGFDPDCFYTQDLQMWMRVAAAFEVGYIHQSLALYRIHQQSTTTDLVRDRDVMIDLERTMNIGLALLDPALRAEARHGANQSMGITAERYRWHLHGIGCHREALRYARRLYRYVPSRRNLFLVFKSWARLIGAGWTPSAAMARRDNG